MNPPIIRLEVESMRYTVMTALTKHAAQMDADVQNAVDRYLTEENVIKIIDETVRDCVNSAVKEEIQRQFIYSGAGRKAIREAVAQYMEKHWGDE